MECACVRDEALDCARARYGDTDEPCECPCHEVEPWEHEGCADPHCWICAAMGG
jgi:hypothetical protein